MKSITTILTCLLITVASGTSFSQTEKKTMKKEVRMEVVNGKKVLTIESTIDGKVKTETFTGAEAEAKMYTMSYTRIVIFIPHTHTHTHIYIRKYPT